MSFFKIDYSETQDFGPIPEGEYEAVIQEVDIKQYNSGNNGLNVKLQIRADVEQDAKKRVVFDGLVSTQKAMFKFQNYAKATNMPEGKSFATEDEFLKTFSKHLKGKAVRIRIKHDNTRDKYIEQVAGVSTPQAAGTPAGANPFNTGAATPPPLPPEPGQATGVTEKAPWEQ